MNQTQLIIEWIRIYRIQIPFSVQVIHSLAERNKSHGFIVEIADQEGLKGYGEGTPRDYVTGETGGESERAAARLAEELTGLNIKGRRELFSILEEAGGSPEASRYPSALCALETALLDLFARKALVPIWRLFSEEPSVAGISYSSVLPLLGRDQLASFLKLTKKYAIRQIKAKVSDKKQAESLARQISSIMGPEIDLRLDANGAFGWNDAVEIVDVMKKEGLEISAFEQPVPKEDLAGLKKVERHSGVPVIADESACTIEDMSAIISQEACSGLSIRLSKCGGLLNCIKAVDMARQKGLFCQLGCHVGETSILAAAGRHLAAVCGPFRFSEGSYSSFLLETDITEDPCIFSAGGYAAVPTGPGLGIDISSSRLEVCSERIFQTD